MKRISEWLFRDFLSELGTSRSSSAAPRPRSAPPSPPSGPTPSSSTFTCPHAGWTSCSCARCAKPATYRCRLRRRHGKPGARMPAAGRADFVGTAGGARPPGRGADVPAPHAPQPPSRHRAGARERRARGASALRLPVASSSIAAPSWDAECVEIASRACAPARARRSCRAPPSGALHADGGAPIEVTASSPASSRTAWDCPSSTCRRDAGRLRALVVQRQHA